MGYNFKSTERNFFIVIDTFLMYCAIVQSIPLPCFILMIYKTFTHTCYAVALMFVVPSSASNTCLLLELSQSCFLL